MHFKIEKSIKIFNERQIKHAVIRFAIAPPIVLFGLISSANFFVNFGPIFEAIKSPRRTAQKYVNIICQASISLKK